MARVLDLIAVIAVAVVLLLPKGSLKAGRALDADPIEMTRVGALEDALFADPEDPARAIELADEYLSLHHPDWALETLSRYGAHADPRVHLVRATAHAERLAPRAAV